MGHPGSMENPGPQNEDPHSFMRDHPIHDQTQNGGDVTTQPALKTFEKQSSTGGKKMHQFLHVSMGGHRFQACLHLEKCSAKHEEIINALPAQLLSSDRRIKTSSPPLLCLKQHIHKLGIGVITRSINISKDSCSGKLYTVS